MFSQAVKNNKKVLCVAWMSTEPNYRIVLLPTQQCDKLFPVSLPSATVSQAAVPDWPADNPILSHHCLLLWYYNHCLSGQKYNAANKFWQLPTAPLHNHTHTYCRVQICFYTLHNKHCINWAVEFYTLQTAQCTLQTKHYTLHTMHCTPHSPRPGSLSLWDGQTVTGVWLLTNVGPNVRPNINKCIS